MPASKRQKTLRDSGVFLESDTDDSGSDSQRVHKNNRNVLNEISGNTRSNPASPDSQAKERAASDVGYIANHTCYKKLTSEDIRG